MSGSIFDLSNPFNFVDPKGHDGEEGGSLTDYFEQAVEGASDANDYVNIFKSIQVNQEGSYGPLPPDLQQLVPPNSSQLPTEPPWMSKQNSCPASGGH